MSERSFVIAFLVILVLVSGGLLFSRFNQNDASSNATPAPTASNQAQATLNPQNVITETPVSGSQKKTYTSFPGVIPAKDLQNKKVVIRTSKGNIEFQIYPEATKAASNFVKLATDKFYDGLKFHRVEPGFVIQGGDPEGTGRGGPGYKFEDEPVTRKYLKGTVAMANAGPNTNGSQFFIMLEDKLDLPPKYTIFGQVTKGQEVVDKIAVGDVMTQVTIEPLK